MSYKRWPFRFVVISVLVVLSLVLVACGGADENPPADQAAEEPVATEEQAEPIEEQPTEPAQEELQPTPEEQASVASTVDTGFRPETNGFSFSNYGDVGVTSDGQAFPVVSLTPAEMLRLFGEGVCAAPPQDGSCVLTPPAEQWMEQNNASMNGGHCEGFAVLSQLMYAGIVDPNQFGAATPAELQLVDNDPLQRELAFWWTTQSPTWGMQQVLDPAAAIQYLQNEYSQNPQNLFRLGIMKADRTGGHAITAYGVQDQGNGIYWIMVYDNNYPGEERHVTVDTNANTWEYEASINPAVQPDLYTGDPNNPIFIAANEPRLQQFPCDFCGGSAQGSAGAGLARLAPRYNEIWTEGDVNIAITDDQDRWIGYDDEGNFLNQITEAVLTPILAGPLTEVPPVIDMPVGMAFTAFIYGDDQAAEEPASVVMIGQGFYIGVDNILMTPDQVDQLSFDGEGDFITYNTDSEESPDIIVGIEKPEADFELVLKAVSISKGTDIHVLFDQKEDVFAFQVTSDAPAQFSVSITRIDADGTEETFDTGDEVIDIEPDKLMYFYFGKWSGQGSDLEIGYDANGNGEIEDSEIINMKDAE